MAAKINKMPTSLRVRSDMDRALGCDGSVSMAWPRRLLDSAGAVFGTDPDYRTLASRTGMSHAGRLERVARRECPIGEPGLPWAHFPPLEGKESKLKKRARYQRMAERALADLMPWLARVDAARAA